MNTEKNTTDLWRNSVYLISQLYFLHKWMFNQYKAKIQYGKNYIKVTLYPTKSHIIPNQSSSKKVTLPINRDNLAIIV